MDEPDLPEPLPAHGVRDLREKVRRRLDELGQEALDNPAVDLGLATRIADTLLALLGASSRLDRRAQLAVRGAVEYFVLSRDVRSDTATKYGFVDDMVLVNNTCDQVGLPELKVVN